ncbi:MAG: response regulator [Candidatus Woykebacteria bacterium]
MSKVLLVEDDSLMVKMYNMKFTHDGFQVETALDGEEGLQKVKDTKPDVIVLDIMLPKMSGTEVLEKIKGDSETKDIPVIVLTNLNVSEEDVKKCKSLGAKEIFMKTDVTPQEIVDKIREYSK